MQTPHHDHGMLGDLFNLLLTPAHLLKSVPEFLTTLDGDYLRAQMDGRLAKNCSRYSVDCSKSMFEVRIRSDLTPRIPCKSSSLFSVC